LKNEHSTFAPTRQFNDILLMFTVAVCGFCWTELLHLWLNIAVVDLIGKARQRGWA